MGYSWTESRPELAADSGCGLCGLAEAWDGWGSGQSGWWSGGGVGELGADFLALHPSSLVLPEV